MVNSLSCFLHSLCGTCNVDAIRSSSFLFLLSQFIPLYISTTVSPNSSIGTFSPVFSPSDLYSARNSFSYSQDVCLQKNLSWKIEESIFAFSSKETSPMLSPRRPWCKKFKKVFVIDILRSV